MKFKKMSYSWLYVVLIVGIIFLACASFIVTTSAQEDNVSPKEPNQELENSCESFYQSYVSFETTQIRFSNNEKFVVTYYVYSEDYITDVEFTQNGFDIISVDKDEKDANRVVAEVLCIPTLETHSLSIQISLSSILYIKEYKIELFILSVLYLYSNNSVLFSKFCNILSTDSACSSSDILDTCSIDLLIKV